MDRAPPKQILVEYDPADVDRFIALADAIEEAFPDLLVEGNPEEDGRPGAFEVSTQEGTPLFSRLASHCYPDPEGLVRAIAASYKGRDRESLEDACG